MQTHFVFRHMDSSDAMRTYAEDRLLKIRRYFSDPLKTSCTFSVEKLDHIVQFDVTLRNGIHLHSSETTDNMYSSIDKALAKMERQVRRYKDRIRNHQPSRGRSAKIRQRVFDAGVSRTPEAPEYVVPVSPQADLPAVIREREFKADRLDLQQAIMQMNLLHKAFLVFTNNKTGDINVVYRTGDGNYGVIETQGHVEG